MKTSVDNDFYIGWVDGVPARTRSFLTRFLAVVGAVFASAALAGALLQQETRAGNFEFGTTRSFAGFVEHVPYPVLAVPRPASGGSYSRWLLSAFGKHGADGLFPGDTSAWYTFDGTVVHRDGRTMIEVVDDSVQQASPPAGLLPPAEERERLGVVTLRGEIVDSKCYLGVMKPGNAASHRACAIRCISGGVPPVLLVRDQDGLATYHLLVDTDGSAVGQRVLPIVGLPVEITGELERVGDLSILRAAPQGYRRIE